MGTDEDLIDYLEVLLLVLILVTKLNGSMRTKMSSFICEAFQNARKSFMVITRGSLKRLLKIV